MVEQSMLVVIVIAKEIIVADIASSYHTVLDFEQ
jgi:hypothetical protein